ncbi:MAG: hypothetical protein JSU57_00760 [Candidatus Heimdallarchaeota archaeon]|nr:MAG: hypothetical protein JSU57_00760 [Candidatus Heimdallarchaeota archaeon]
MVNEKTSDREIFLRSAETELIDYLKQLSSLPAQSSKKEDPISIILQKYVKKWRGVKK